LHKKETSMINAAENPLTKVRRDSLMFFVAVVYVL